MTTKPLATEEIENTARDILLTAAERRVALLESIIQRADDAMFAPICPHCQRENDGELSIDTATWERLLVEVGVLA